MVVVADVRWYLDGRSGAEAYRSVHIAGAVFVDLDHCLAGPPSAEAGRHPLPAADDFARAMSGLGIGDTTRVVAYDDAGGTIAARMTSARSFHSFVRSVSPSFSADFAKRSQAAQHIAAE